MLVGASAPWGRRTDLTAQRRHLETFTFTSTVRRRAIPVDLSPPYLRVNSIPLAPKQWDDVYDMKRTSGDGVGTDGVAAAVDTCRDGNAAELKRIGRVAARTAEERSSVPRGNSAIGGNQWNRRRTTQGSAKEKGAFYDQVEAELPKLRQCRTGAACMTVAQSPPRYRTEDASLWFCCRSCARDDKRPPGASLGRILTNDTILSCCFVHDVSVGSGIQFLQRIDLVKR